MISYKVEINPMSAASIVFSVTMSPDGRKNTFTSAEWKYNSF
jgi:hypothetical protein